MALSESETRAKLIDPAIHKRGWTEDLIRQEETAGSIDITGEKARRRSKGRIDYTLRVMVNPNTQPVAVALIEAKRDYLPPTHGMEQGKAYADSKRLNVPFVFSFMENAVYDLKAVNPHTKNHEDTRTPEELLNLIEAKGREIAESLAVLRRTRTWPRIAQNGYRKQGNQESDDVGRPWQEHASRT
jgi:type I restriction enzyme R subunit